jgi:DNA polymerase-1
MSLTAFREVVLADFEFVSLPGERPRPLCLVVHELRSGRRFRLWQDQFGAAPPYAVGRDVLFVAYVASAELGCYRALKGPMPERVLDASVEFRVRTNGLELPAGRGLLGALTFFGLDASGATEKKELQEAIGSNTWQGRFTKQEILEYCEQDVIALARLLPALISQLDVPRAVYRARYSGPAVSAMMWAGIPIDVELLGIFRENWKYLQEQLIAAVDVDYHVYDGTTFKLDLFGDCLAANNIPWPRTETGRLATDDDTFKEMAKAYPKVSPLRELRSSVGKMRLFDDLAVGKDARNRTPLWAFGTKTSRNAPSSTEYIFGNAVWLRGLIRPPKGFGVAYIDWSQQEFAIAAALSGDHKMQAAYRSGDAHLALAKQAGAVPADATKESHPHVRALFKQCNLAIQYMMGERSFALRIGEPPIVARDLLNAHRNTFKIFWKWSDAAVDTAVLRGNLHTTFGWPIHVTEKYNPRSIRNFPMQANGAEMMRLAACLITEREVELSGSIHDAFLVCSKLETLDEHIRIARSAMEEASRIVLDGFGLRTDVQVVKWPDRYMDEDRGRVMWVRVMQVLEHQLLHHQKISA